MRIRRLYPGSFGANCWLLIARDGQAAVVDPSPDAETVLHALREENACASGILLTHGHFDHILSLDTLRDSASIPALIHGEDLDLPGDARKNAFEAFFRQRRTWRTPDGTFADGERLQIGDETVTVLHTPGHTPGSCCFLVNDGQDILPGTPCLTGPTDGMTFGAGTRQPCGGRWNGLQSWTRMPAFIPVTVEMQPLAARCAGLE